MQRKVGKEFERITCNICCYSERRRFSLSLFLFFTVNGNERKCQSWRFHALGVLAFPPCVCVWFYPCLLLFCIDILFWLLFSFPLLSCGIYALAFDLFESIYTQRENLCRFHRCFGRIISLCVWNLSFVIFFWRSVYVFWERGKLYASRFFKGP